MILPNRCVGRLGRAEWSGLMGLALVAATAMAPIARAAQFIVTTNSDSGPGSLRAAIINANNAAGADTITFAPALNGQTITLTTGELLVSDDVTITGPGANQLTVSGNNASRVFNFNGGTSMLSGLTIMGGNGSPPFDGGGIYNTATLSVTSSTISGNDALGGLGGGFFNSG